MESLRKAQKNMSDNPKVCETELQDQTLIITLAEDLVWAIHELHEEVDRLVESVNESKEIKNVIADFHINRFYSTGTLQMLARIWNIIRTREGQMVLCSVSEAGMEAILRTGLQEVWPIYPDRESAWASLDS